MGFPSRFGMDARGLCPRFVGDTPACFRSLERGIFNPLALRSMIDKQGVGGRQLWGALSLNSGTVSLLMLTLQP